MSCDGPPLTKEMIFTEHEGVFQGLSEFPGPPMRLHFKEGYKASSRGIYKAPVHMEKGIEEEVKNMVN